MTHKTYFLFLFVLILIAESFSAWTDTTISSDSQLGDDAQFIVVNVNGTIQGTPHVTITGGSIGTLIVNGSAAITMQGGTISNDFWVFDPENLDDDGLIRCPYENNVSLNNTSTMIVSGGIIEGHIYIASGAQMDLYGYDFQYTEERRWRNLGEQVTNVRLLGYWQNDQPLDLYFVDNSFNHVTLHVIPEPATFLLLASSRLLLKRRG
ncbi:MAG: hypothetical protein LLF76_09255 [Planctomycetaceae bacterium]|nr:hypothetical protein [Planctomycetaceae bacterium]